VTPLGQAHQTEQVALGVTLAAAAVVNRVLMALLDL
jgi:hypothetical protein